MRPLAESHICILGLGLMGGSLAGAVKGHCLTLSAFDCDMATRHKALDWGLVDHCPDTLSAAVAETDVLILATPVRSIIELLPQLPPLLRDGCLIMDLGSTKTDIAAVMAQLPASLNLLPAHPMCGTEHSGIDAADPQIYRGARFLLCPLERTPPQALGWARELAGAIEAEALELDVQLHDELVAAVSHLPYLSSSALVANAEQHARQSSVVWELVASGFRDSSRLAGSNLDMMLDILVNNRNQICANGRAYISTLNRWLDLLEAGDEATLKAQLAEARTRRRNLFVG